MQVKLIDWQVGKRQDVKQKKAHKKNNLQNMTTKELNQEDTGTREAGHDRDHKPITTGSKC